MRFGDCSSLPSAGAKKAVRSSSVRSSFGTAQWPRRSPGRAAMGGGHWWSVSWVVAISNTGTACRTSSPPWKWTMWPPHCPGVRTPITRSMILQLRNFFSVWHRLRDELRSRQCSNLYPAGSKNPSGHPRSVRKDCTSGKSITQFAVSRHRFWFTVGTSAGGSLGVSAQT
jgi:hypothetical protein